MSDRDTAAGNTWATYLKTARQAKGWTIDQLADKADVNRMTIMRWESGRSGFKHETVERVAVALGVDPALALAVARGDLDAELPPPLPTPIARLVQHYQDMTDADRAVFLERIDWVNEWAEGRLERYSHRRHTGSG